MRYYRAFTLVELLVTIAVLAVLVSLAAPAFNSLIRENGISARSTELQASLQLARSEALKRRENVTVCRSNADQTDCDDDTDWASGWLVRLANGTVVKVWNAVQGVTITGPAAGIFFRSNGLASAAETWTVSHSDCTGEQQRTLSVSSTGSTSLTKGACP